MTAVEAPRRTRILALASGGGHWQQLMEMRPAFEGCEVTYATTLAGLPEEFGASPAVIVPDFSRSDLWRLPVAGWRIGGALRRCRPDIVISTGALPGVTALALGKLFGARTIWVDSVANAEEMSLSGKMARRVADLWLSQWPHVAEESGAGYFGAVL